MITKPVTLAELSTLTNPIVHMTAVDSIMDLPFINPMSGTDGDVSDE